MLDLNFELAEGLSFQHQLRGLQILRENAWVDDKGGLSEEEELLDFLEEMLREIEEGKQYLKVKARVKLDVKSWFQEKQYLIKQLRSKGKLKVQLEDRLQIFTIEDMCYTNYSGIWLWKHFYL